MAGHAAHVQEPEQGRHGTLEQEHADSWLVARMWEAFEGALGPLPPLVHSPCCSEFLVAAQRIRAHPKAFYVHLCDWIASSLEPASNIARFFELTWCASAHRCIRAWCACSTWIPEAFISVDWQRCCGQPHEPSMPGTAPKVQAASMPPPRMMQTCALVQGSHLWRGCSRAPPARVRARGVLAAPSQHLTAQLAGGLCRGRPDDGHLSRCSA